MELGIKGGREALKAQWKTIRRGWYLGGEGFRERLLERPEKVLRSRRQELKYTWRGQEEHRKEQAKQLLKLGDGDVGDGRA